MENTTSSQNGNSLTARPAWPRPRPAPQASFRAGAWHLPHPRARRPALARSRASSGPSRTLGCHTNCRGDRGECGDVSRGATWAVPCLTVEETEVREGHGGPRRALSCDADAEPSEAHGPELRVDSAGHCPQRLPSKHSLLQRGQGCTLHTSRGGPQDQASEPQQAGHTHVTAGSRAQPHLWAGLGPWSPPPARTPDQLSRAQSRGRVCASTRPEAPREGTR